MTEWHLPYSHCPKCNCQHMSYGSPVVTEQALSIHLPMTCNKCREEWIDVFTYKQSHSYDHVD